MEEAAKQLLDNLTSLGSIKSQKNIQQLESYILNYTKYFPSSNNDKHKEKPDGFLYGKIIEKILQTFDNNWPIQNENINSSIFKLMIVDCSTFPMLHELLISSNDFLKQSSNNQAIDSLSIILEKVIKSDSLFSAILDVCRSSEKSEIEIEEYEKSWKDFLQILVALPTRIANKRKGNISKTFMLENYSRIISYHLVRAILFIEDHSKEFKTPPNIKMISMMISKIILILGVQKFIELFEILIFWSLEEHGNKKSLIQNILYHLEKPSIEPVSVLLLKLIKTSVQVPQIIGNLLKNDNWKHALTTKIPLLSFYDNNKLIINLISYLSYDEHDDQILIDLIIKLLDIWGDRSALNHTSLEQHEYITKLILFSIKKMEKRLKKSDKDTIQKLLFSGTSAHLENMNIEVRAIGMITGELVFEILTEKSDAPKLCYEYDDMPIAGKEIVHKLKTFINEDWEKITQDSTNDNSSTQNNLIKELGIKCSILSEKDEKVSSETICDNNCKKENIQPVQRLQQNSKSIHDNDDDDVSDLDSDDDLVPYDMSNDTKISDKLRPVYLRDLKEILISNHSNAEPDKFSEALISSKDLILSQLPNDDSSLAIELLEILSTLKETSYVENFEVLRYQSCVAITTIYPKVSAEFLCREFHAKMGTYSINDRIFFLQVLSEAAKQLSSTKNLNNENNKIEKENMKIEKFKKPNKSVSLYIDITTGKKHETLYDEDIEVFSNNENKRSNWEELVQKRIQSNTRVFAHKTKIAEATLNKFNDVAASFFYPLLYGLSQKEACMYKTTKSFEDQDNILLIHFLKTLSTIMVAAQNCVIAPKMGLEILELAWTLRYHQQSKVRLIVIENIASVIVSITRENLSTEIIELLLEFRIWLSEVSQNSIRGDPDSACRHLGQCVVELIDSMITTNMTCN